MKESLKKYFQNNKHQVSLQQLVKTFNINRDDVGHLIDVLYELEMEGEIINVDNNSFLHVPVDSYLKIGDVSLSAKGNFYIHLDHGDIALINDHSSLVPGDKVFFTLEKNNKHNHQYKANIKRVIKKISYNSNYLTKATICKNYNKNYFYILSEKNEKIYIPDKFVNGAYPGDEVNVTILLENSNKIAKVEEILKRKNNEHIFQVFNDSGILKIRPIGTYISEYIHILPDGAREDDFLLYDVSSIPKFIKKLDGFNQEVLLYASEYGFETIFDDATLKEADEISGVISSEEENRRVDLRGLTTFTIDSVKAKDLDDAVSLVKLDDRYILYVSIADVAHFVKPGSNLFRTASVRTTSIYPANMVIPMLPSKLSNAVCSLNEKEDKLTKTVKMEIDASGKVINFDIFNSIINSDKKMAYNYVNDILEGKKIEEGYEDYIENLKDMYELSKILEDTRMKRGYVYLNTEEYEYELDDIGNVTSVNTRGKGISEGIIENFMLIANETVASFIHNLDINGAYRNHAYPDINYISQLKKNHNDLKKYVNSIHKIQNPKILQKILLNIFSGKTEEEISYLSKIILKGMARAYYSINNIGHYGLALEEYMNFTSPIRRFPDLLNHLIVDYILSGRFNEIDTLTKDYETLCVRSSEKQYDADMFEANINFMLLNKFLGNLEDEKLEARVIFMGKDFIYIKTYNGICGIININRGSYDNEYVILNGDKIKINDLIYVSFDHVQDNNSEVIFTYIGKKTNKKGNEKKLIKKEEEK